MSVKVVRSTKLICVDSKVFELGITPNAFRLYCQVLYEAEKYQENKIYEVDFSGCRIESDDVRIAYQELFDLGLLESQNGVITVADLSPVRSIPSVIPKKAEIPKNEFIYVVHAVDLQLHKIGCTNNVARRYKELKHQQIPSDLELIASYKVTDAAKAENYLHKFFSEKQVHSEWFCLTKKDLSAIDSELAAMGGVRESSY